MIKAESKISSIVPRYNDIPAELRERLTPRESEVCDQILKGFGDNEIAQNLKMEQKSVKEYFRRICRKADVHSRMELIKHCFPVSEEHYQAAQKTFGLRDIEAKVLEKCIATGSKSGAAKSMEIGRTTVATHLARAFEKMSKGSYGVATLEQAFLEVAAVDIETPTGKTPVNSAQNRDASPA